MIHKWTRCHQLALTDPSEFNFYALGIGGKSVEACMTYIGGHTIRRTSDTMAANYIGSYGSGDCWQLGVPRYF
jgi:hypothetical protein